jgi:asparagine N-glycosylation enzyme membrane subunit Stt3
MLEKQMSMSKFNRRWVVVVLLFTILVVALYLRVSLTHNGVFVGDNVKFATNNAYSLVLQTDNLIHHFPHFPSFNPYLNSPTGLSQCPFNLLIFLLGGILSLLGVYRRLGMQR